MVKKERRELRVVLAGYGSGCRSALCPFEHGYVAFESKEFGYLRWWNEKASHGIGIKEGVEFTISAIITESNNLQRVKIIGS